VTESSNQEGSDREERNLIGKIWLLPDGRPRGFRKVPSWFEKKIRNSLKKSKKVLDFADNRSVDCGGQKW
jgi:hypothetical protein